MFKSLLFLLGITVASATSAASPPLQLLESDLSNVKSHSQTIKKWNCSNYKDTLSIAACEYFKAHLSHQERDYGQAQKHVTTLTSVLTRNFNFALLELEPTFFKDNIKQSLEMFGTVFESVEHGTLDGMSVEALLLSDGNQQDPLASAIKISNLIDILYDDRKGKFIKQAYLTLGQDLLEWQMLEGKHSTSNAAKVYETVLSKIILGDENKNRHLEYVNKLWKQIPKSARSQNLDTLIAVYIQSGQKTLRAQDFNSALSQLDSTESNSDDVKVRLYAIYFRSIVESIPESDRMPSNGDYSKVLVRYFHLLSPVKQKQFKNSLNASVDIVLSKSSPKSDIDEIAVATHVIYRDVLDAPKREGNYYKLMDKKYSVLRKDYVDFTDQSSQEYSIINSLGALSRTPLGEGLM